MKYKIKIDRDTRTLLLKYIRKFDEYKTWLESEKDRAIFGAGKEITGMPKGNSTSDRTERSAELLIKIESTHKAKVVKAITNAKELIGIKEIVSENERKALARAIWLSCLNGRKYNFEHFAGMIPCERRRFYYYKNEFLEKIRIELGI